MSEQGAPRGESPNWLTNRPAVENSNLSLSMGGHCRMELWLRANGYKPEPVTPSAERVFEYGDVMEALVFDEMTIGGRPVGNWWIGSSPASLR